MPVNNLFYFNYRLKVSESLIRIGNNISNRSCNIEKFIIKFNNMIYLLGNKSNCNQGS